jgi:hypothetical protein
MVLESLKMEDEEELEDWSADACVWQAMLNESGVVDLGDDLVDDWESIQKLLPAGWEEQARQTRAFLVRRPDGFDSPATLLRVISMHLAQGASLRMTARQATLTGVAAVCDVAVLKRLRQWGEWFGWMTQKSVGELISPLTPAPMQAFPGRCLQLVDGSVVCEPGGKGAKWRVHFALDLLRGRCRQVEVTTHREAESLARFSWNSGDIVIADRNFAKVQGIGHVRQCGADVIVRAKLCEPVLRDAEGERIAILSRLRTLPEQGVGDWRVWLGEGEQRMPMRPIAWKMPDKEANKARERLRKTAIEKQRQLRPETLEAAGYVFPLTTPREATAPQILALYRMRWQIELAFKRMKSLLGLGKLKKVDPAGARAWLQGKLPIACLIEKTIAVGDLFSPRMAWRAA